MAVLTSSVIADIPLDERALENIWTQSGYGMHVAESGGNPWALPRPQREKPRGPSYLVNPHFVTPEDIEADSTPEPDRKQKRKRRSSSTERPEDYYTDRQPEWPYGSGYMPGYQWPGYGGYYGSLPGMDGGAPGFGGDPLLYPYGGMGLGDPYNMMTQPYSPGSEDDGE